ncbi:hypothetical protein [Chitinophaga barathri]|uniref:hypothetical protein n=1 Tax=Chitinophaga barathri TaxID=1647451 RepID=UPI001C863A23|nr:hypothetical protein [Chitinophaga barathri]
MTDSLNAFLIRELAIPGTLPEQANDYFQRATIDGRPCNLLFGVDSLIINDTLLINTSKRGDTSKIIFQKLHFTKRVIILGDELNREIEFRYCYFEQPVYILGHFNKKIEFYRNIFDDNFRLGTPDTDKLDLSAITEFSKEFSLRQNVFMKSFMALQSGFKDDIYFYNNLFNQIEITGCIFHKTFRSLSDKIQGHAKIFSVRCFRDFGFWNCKFQSSFRITNSWFSQNLSLAKCGINRKKAGEKSPEDGLIYRCHFSKILNFDASDIQHLKIHNSFFKKDSSALLLTHSSINSLEVTTTTYPYLIDLSNTTISDTGTVDLRNMAILDPTDLGLDSTIDFSQRNRDCYIYLDKTSLNKILFDYRDFKLASIFYDPTVENKTKELSFELTEFLKLRFLDSSSAPSMDDADFITLGVVEQAGMLPPFPDSAWRGTPGGLVRKENLYNSMLLKFKEENNSKSYAKLDMEYRKFMLLEFDPGWYNTLSYYAGKLWWDFGYKKSRIFLWIVFFFAAFSLLNWRRLYFLSNKVYAIENISKQLRVHKKLKHIRLAGIPPAPVTGKKAGKWITRTKNSIGSAFRKTGIFAWYYASTMLLSFIYTGFIFFGLRMDGSKFHLKRNIATIWVLFIYTMGIICTGFVINLILH